MALCLGGGLVAPALCGPGRRATRHPQGCVGVRSRPPPAVGGWGPPGAVSGQAPEGPEGGPGGTAAHRKCSACVGHDTYFLGGPDQREAGVPGSSYGTRDSVRVFLKGGGAEGVRGGGGGGLRPPPPPRRRS